jgi:hypothetical protein
MKEVLSSSETSVLTKPHGVTFLKTPFFKKISVHIDSLIYTIPDCIVLLRFEVFKAVTMKNVVFWDIKTQFLPHKRPAG